MTAQILMIDSEDQVRTLAGDFVSCGCWVVHVEYRSEVTHKCHTMSFVVLATTLQDARVKAKKCMRSWHPNGPIITTTQFSLMSTTGLKPVGLNHDIYWYTVFCSNTTLE